jgi:hypothetical protein
VFVVPVAKSTSLAVLPAMILCVRRVVALVYPREATPLPCPGGAVLPEIVLNSIRVCQ